MRRIVFVMLVPALLLPFLGGGAGCGKDGETEPAGLDCSEGAPPDDFDCDGVANLADNCLDAYNPSQADEDGDGTGDLCEIVPCGDGVCDPGAGECDVFDYCTKDCNRSRCFGLPEGETCGDGFCDVLAGECADADPCIDDCPDPEFCFPFTCGDRVCQPWEDDPSSGLTFCYPDCICQIPKDVTDECHTDADCLGTPGTVCAPTSFPVSESEEDFLEDILQVVCACSTCGNGVLDEGEGCDVSAGFEGVEVCLSQGPDAACFADTCECVTVEEPVEFNCVDGLDDDGDFLVDCGDAADCCADPACSADPACGPPPEPGCGNGVLDEGEECDESAPDSGLCGALRCVDPGQTGALGEPECTCEPPPI